MKASSHYEHYYELLGVSSKANRDEIVDAYRRLVAKVHPDVLMGKEEVDGVNAVALFQEITAAYKTLTNEELRKQYDQELSDRGLLRYASQKSGGLASSPRFGAPGLRSISGLRNLLEENSQNLEADPDQPTDASMSQIIRVHFEPTFIKKVVITVLGITTGSAVGLGVYFLIMWLIGE